MPGAPRARTAAYFVSRWCIVQVLYGDVNGAIEAFNVTSTHPRFRPTFRHSSDLGEAQLLVTTFASWGEPPSNAMQWATRYFTYVEEFSFGNFADHLWFQLAITPLGSYDGTPPLDTQSPTFRNDHVITTYGQSLEPFGTEVYIGGDPGDLRHLLPKPARGFVGSVRG